MQFPIDALRAYAAEVGEDWRDVIRKKIACAEYTGAFWRAKLLRKFLD